MAIWTIESKLPAHLDRYDYTASDVARLARHIASAKYREDLEGRCDFVLAVGNPDLDTLAEIEDDEQYQQILATSMNRIGCVAHESE